MTDPTFAAATTKRIAEQERELQQLRLRVAEQAATIRAQAHTIAALREDQTAQQLRLQRVQLGIGRALETLTERG
jgi:hypothetical protein